MQDRHCPIGPPPGVPMTHLPLAADQVRSGNVHAEARALPEDAVAAMSDAGNGHGRLPELQDASMGGGGNSV
jgi:hypothetical protein